MVITLHIINYHLFVTEHGRMQIRDEINSSRDFSSFGSIGTGTAFADFSSAGAESINIVKINYVSGIEPRTACSPTLVLIHTMLVSNIEKVMTFLEVRLGIRKTSYANL